MDDKLQRLCLKKIKKEIGKGQAILHLSSKQKQIAKLLEKENIYTKASSLDDLSQLGLSKTHKAFTYVIADMDLPELDDFDRFLEKIAPMIIRPGLLIIIASNLCTFKNQIAIWFGNELENFVRPVRAVPGGYLRNHLLEKGYFVKNRFWQFDEKLLVMADIPVRY